MVGPSDDFRRYVWEQAEGVDNEDALSELLDQIEMAVREDGPVAPVAPEEELAAAESWASVASYAVGRLSAPASPWPRNVAGWGTRAVGRLRSIANTLSATLSQVAPQLGAQSFSIGVSFPWGIQISLSW